MNGRRSSKEGDNWIDWIDRVVVKGGVGGAASVILECFIGRMQRMLEPGNPTMLC